MSEAETRRVVRALYDAYAAGDLEGMLDLMAEDVEVTFLAQGTFRGKPAVRRFIDFSAGLLTDLDWRLDASLSRRHFPPYVDSGEPG